jgi:hypothetical protein
MGSNSSVSRLGNPRDMAKRVNRPSLSILDRREKNTGGGSNVQNQGFDDEKTLIRPFEGNILRLHSRKCINEDLPTKKHWNIVCEQGDSPTGLTKVHK